ncbi:hypothetical protein Q8A67_024612 [Cirrhinus molitorella]|uniref:Chemokine interleukin-8-like domain-containing protein n=1 Tax=Cirrhinus molitorella TaxID=172907 RepID=A0AA88P0I6_9TELE|nr:hypothetical protein Q8A67_024612 [Cirrhinus molitorella]
MSCVSITYLQCLAVMLLTQVTCQIKGRANCLCLRTSKRIPPKQNIESYMIQIADVCHIDAIFRHEVSLLSSFLPCAVSVLPHSRNKSTSFNLLFAGEEKQNTSKQSVVLYSPESRSLPYQCHCLVDQRRKSEVC